MCRRRSVQSDGFIIRGRDDKDALMCSVVRAAAEVQMAEEVCGKLKVTRVNVSASRGAAKLLLCVRACVCVRSIKDSDVFIEVNVFPLTVKSHSYGDVTKLLNSSEV